MLQGCPVNAANWDDYVYDQIKDNEGLNEIVEPGPNGVPTSGPSSQ